MFKLKLRSFFHLGTFLTLCSTLIFSPLVQADFDDFIDVSKIKKEEQYCAEALSRCNRSCNDQEGKSLQKCIDACVVRAEKCLDNAPYANKDALNRDKLPPDAQKELDKILKKQDKALDKCQTMYTKQWAKCEKKFGVDQGKQIIGCIDKSKVQVKQDACIEKVMQKHSYKSKKMVQLLEGKTPE